MSMISQLVRFYFASYSFWRNRERFIESYGREEEIYNRGRADGGSYCEAPVVCSALSEDEIEKFFTPDLPESQLFAVMFGAWWGVPKEQLEVLAAGAARETSWQLLDHLMTRYSRELPKYRYRYLYRFKAFDPDETASRPRRLKYGDQWLAGISVDVEIRLIDEKGKERFYPEDDWQLAVDCQYVQAHIVRDGSLFGITPRLKLLKENHFDRVEFKAVGYTKDFWCSEDSCTCTSIPCSRDEFCRILRDNFAWFDHSDSENAECGAYSAEKIENI